MIYMNIKKEDCLYNKGKKNFKSTWILNCCEGVRICGTVVEFMQKFLREIIDLAKLL